MTKVGWSVCRRPTWAAGELCIRGAGIPTDRLPIPQEVGEALADYLQHVRPACASRQVFVRLRAPHRFLSRMIEAQVSVMGFRESFLFVAAIFLAALLPAWYMRTKPHSNQAKPLAA